MKTLITSYKNPDLDGVACAYSYAEFMRGKGEDVAGAVSGIPQREAQFVLNAFGVPDLGNAEGVIGEAENIILVDTSNLKELSEKLDPKKVIEIIDHRKVHDAPEFSNAQVQIELVGSAATLVAEKFYSAGAEISKESAALLFLAIVSSTVNFQASITTGRDRAMAEWLKTKFALPENFIRDMFADKSQLNRSIKETMADDLAQFTFNGKSLGIAQLEIVDVDEFVEKRGEEIKKALQELKQEVKVDLIFLTCIDLDKAFNKIVVIDDEMQSILEKALGVQFENGIAHRDGILMRKEIIPKVKEVIESGD